LQTLCEKERISCAGLKKQEMIDLLKGTKAAADLGGGDDAGEEEELDDEEEEEIEQDGENSEGDSGSGQNGDSVETQPELSEAQMQLKALELKIKLVDMERKAQKQQMEAQKQQMEAQKQQMEAQKQQIEFNKANWELEKAKIKFKVDNGLPQETAAAVAERDLRHLLPSMGSDDQVLTFFHAYEKCLLLQKVDKSRWGKWLPACLNAKASKVFMSLTVEQCEDYDVVKKAVLDNFRMTSKKYLENFRSMRRSGQDSYSMFVNKLGEMHKYYTDSKEIKTFDELVQQDILEQFLTSLPPAVKQFVEGREPKTPMEAGRMADLHYETQNAGPHFNRQSFNKDSRKPAAATQQNEGAKSNDNTAGQEARAPAFKSKKISCYSCQGNHLQKKLHAEGCKWK